MKTRNLFAYILMALVVIITIMAILHVWGVIPNIDQYIGKMLGSLVIVVISGVVIYIISAIFNLNTGNNRNQNNTGNQIP